MRMRFSGLGAVPYTRSPPIRPEASIPCEHMFCMPRTPTLAQRVAGALRTTRSFLTFEDGCEVGWEVDGDERLEVVHPHRTALRGRSARTRAGQPAPAPQVCECPVGERARAWDRTAVRGGQVARAARGRAVRCG